MPDQRKDKRYKVNTYVGIYEETTNILVGCLIDLSVDGMQIICEIPLRADAKYKLRIELPNFVCKEGKLILNAENVWIQNYSKPGFYTAGFKLHNISMDIKNQIEKLLESEMFNMNECQASVPQADT